MSTLTVRENIHSDSTASLQLFAHNTQREKQRQATGTATLRESDGGQNNSIDAGVTFRERDNWKELFSSQDSQFLDQYTVLEALYTGAEAQLYLAQRNTDGEKVVLKFYHHGMSPDPAVLDRLTIGPSENVMAVVDHGIQAGRGLYFEVSEFYENGDLAMLLGAHRLPETSCRKVLEQVAAALATLHTPDTESRILVHRDVKPANILIKSVAPLNLVLCDFGISSIVDHGIAEHPSNRNCTPRYAAPELFYGRVSSESDYWSLGLTMLEVLTGTHPLHDVSDEHIAALLQSGWRPDTRQFSFQWQQLLNGLTELEPEIRWSHKEVKLWLSETAIEKPVEPEIVEDLFRHFQDLKSMTAIELAARLAMCWQRIVPLLDDNLFRSWLECESKRLSVGKTVSELIDDPGPSGDIRLLRLIYRIAPSMRHVWKEWSMRRTVMADYCTNAMNGDEMLLALVEEIFDLGVVKELAVLSDDLSLKVRAYGWHKTVEEYEITKLKMEQLGAPVDRFPPRSKVLATLYLLECESGKGVQLFDTEIDIHLLFFNPWLEPLKFAGRTPGSAERLLRSLFLPNCADRNKQNFKIRHEEISESVRVEGLPGRTFGWNPPTISLHAVHIDYVMTIGEEKKVVGKGVHLRWEVRNALLVHLNGFGLVRAVGELPNERMARTAVPHFVHECPCTEHNSAWFAITQTTEFAIRAINVAGYSSMRLPPIVVPQPVIEMDCSLDVHVPELFPPVEIDMPGFRLFERPELFLPVSLAVPSAGPDNLPDVELLDVPEFVKRDIWPESYEKMDAILSRLKFR